MTTVRPLPSTDRGRRTRAAIIDAAAATMYANGVAATSLDEVLRASGTGKSQLYHYFADKADLVGAVLDRQVEQVLACQPGITSTDTWDGLQAWADELLAGHRGPAGPLACPLGTLSSELKNDDSYQPLLADAFGRWEAPLAAGLRAMRTRGELLEAADPDRLAAMLIAALQGGMLLARTKRDVTVLEDVVRATLDTIATFRAGAAD